MVAVADLVNGSIGRQGSRDGRREPVEIAGLFGHEGSKEPERPSGSIADQRAVGRFSDVLGDPLEVKVFAMLYARYADSTYAGGPGIAR